MRRSDVSRSADSQSIAVTAPPEVSDGHLSVSFRETAASPGGLIAYALALVVAAGAAIVVAAAAYPVLPSIAITEAGPSAGAAVTLGVAFWVVFGFVGSVRPRAWGGVAVITFHMPFVIAGTILGGPLVGALMGVISLTELRELRRAPWYGVLANHAICVIAAVIAGIGGLAVDALIEHGPPAGEAAHLLVVGAVVSVLFVAVNLLLVLPVIVFRTGSEFGSVVRRSTSTLRVTLAAEVSLGWLMAVTYLTVAWWAPLVCVLVILAVWDAHDRREALRRDPMTGLLNSAGVQPYLESAFDEARRLGRRHALLFIDLDKFGRLNKDHGEDVADDLLRAVALRIANAVRGTDAVGRQHRAGDEFIVLLRDLPDGGTAVALGWRLHAAIRRPVRVRGATLQVSVGASIGVAVLLPRTVASLDAVKRLADARMQQVKRAGGGVLGPPDERSA
jgi:diguanylate cyclase (GGDEF)-like protein